MAQIEKRGGRQGPRYRVWIRRKDLGEVSKTFRSRKTAERWARRAEIELEERVWLGGQGRYTVSQAIDRYLERELGKLARSNRHNVERHLEWWRVRVGALGLGEVDRLHRRIVDGLDELLAGGRTPATVNRYRQALARVFSLASGRWRWCRENPFRAIPREREPRLRVRYLDPGTEKPALLAACRRSRSRKLYPFVMTALVTGARQGSIKVLEWDRDVQLERGRILFRHTKNRNPVNARITDELGSALIAWRCESPYGPRSVFGGTFSRWAFHYACERAGIEDFRFHDLRHTCASYLVMAGASPHEVMAQLGLLTLSQVMKYAHLAPNAADWVVEKMSREQYGLFEEGEKGGTA